MTFMHGLRKKSALTDIEREANRWLRLMKSGQATREDAQSLRQWCAKDQTHAEAFNAAMRSWDAMLPAVAIAAQQNHLQLSRDDQQRRTKSRRMFVGGAVLASSAVATVAVLSPSSGLLTMVNSRLYADYRTDIGQQRSVEMGKDVVVAMNTKSSIAVYRHGDDTMGVKLLDGEIAVDAMQRQQPFYVQAANGSVFAKQAQFELRYLGQDVCVTCIAGVVEVRMHDKLVTLGAAQQVVYAQNAIQHVQSIVPDEVSAWRKGVLRFRDTALSQVIEEINRYHAGKVILMAQEMADRPVSGSFTIHDLGRVIGQIQRLFQLNVTSLPGGIVILRQA
jgi:transmembrane sensor